MKIFKFFWTSIIVLLSFFSFFSFSVSANTNCQIPINAGAQNHDEIMKNFRDCAKGGEGVSVGTGSTGADSFRQRIMDFSSGFLRYAALFAVAAIVFAGVLYTTAYGDGERLTKAKTIVIYACVGLLLALTSYSLVNAVLAIIYGSV